MSEPALLLPKPLGKATAAEHQKTSNMPADPPPAHSCVEEEYGSSPSPVPPKTRPKRKGGALPTATEQVSLQVFLVVIAHLANETSPASDSRLWLSPLATELQQQLFGVAAMRCHLNRNSCWAIEAKECGWDVHRHTAVSNMATKSRSFPGFKPKVPMASFKNTGSGLKCPWKEVSAFWTGSVFCRGLQQRLRLRPRQQPETSWGWCGRGQSRGWQAEWQPAISSGHEFPVWCHKSIQYKLLQRSLAIKRTVPYFSRAFLRSPRLGLRAGKAVIPSSIQACHAWVLHYFNSFGAWVDIFENQTSWA